jgi:hypothetical protein
MQGQQAARVECQRSVALPDALLLAGRVPGSRERTHKAAGVGWGRRGAGGRRCCV